MKVNQKNKRKLKLLIMEKENVDCDQRQIRLKTMYWEIITNFRGNMAKIFVNQADVASFV